MAYGVNAPSGLQAWGTLNDSTPSLKVDPQYIPSGYASSIFKGDRVTLVGGNLVVAAAGTPAIGVFNGCSYIDATGNPQWLNYWLGSTVTYNAQAAEALVTDAPLTLYNVQVSNSLNVASPSITQSMLNLNANLSLGGGGNLISPANPTAGSTRTGNSGYYLDFSTLGTGSNLDVKIVRFTPQPGNVSELPFNNVLVTLNNDVYRGTGVGISNYYGLTVVTGANYTALPGDETINVTVSGAPRTITIPTAGATNIGKVYIIKDVAGTAAANNITVTPASGNIDGSTTSVINANYGKVTVYSNGTQWFTR